MGNVVLETRDLSKQYKSQLALSHVNLRLQQGKIYGLIGKNGAGKRIGSLIEAPGLVAGMTAKENLHLQCLMKGMTNYEIENELLELVGLQDAEKKKVKNFSLGMKQRLGIAVTLIGNPDLLMLDEPINGLDPAGVIEIRNLIKKLSAYENKTILISSHNLPELYQVATDFIMIHEGEIREALTHEELDERCKSYIALEAVDVNQLTAVLEEKLHTQNFQVMPDKNVKLFDYLDERERVGRILHENDVIITKMSVCGTSLEDYFMSVVERK